MKVIVYSEMSSSPLIADSLVDAAREFVEYGWTGPVVRIETSEEAPLIEAFNAVVTELCGGVNVLQQKFEEYERTLNDKAREVRRVGNDLAESGWDFYDSQKVDGFVTEATAKIRGLLTEIVALRAEKEACLREIEAKLKELSEKQAAP